MKRREYFLNKENYGIDSIESLSFKEAIQKRIQMYLGTANTEGIWQGLKEIINNSTDEALGGYGDKIIMARNCHKSVYNAVEICGLKPVYFFPETNNNSGIISSISPE